MFLQHSDTLDCENEMNKEFRELKQQKQNRYSGSATVTLLIINVDMF